jgi:hypothetical protein
MRRRNIQILEEGHITPENITSMKFEFSKPDDITSSLDKRNKTGPPTDIPQNPGRTGYTSMTAVYPNEESLRQLGAHGEFKALRLSSS